MLLVALGGAIGTALRYLVATVALEWAGPTFPWGTLTVNLVGSFAIGLVQQLATESLAMGEETRLFFTTGRHAGRGCGLPLVEPARQRGAVDGDVEAPPQAALVELRDDVVELAVQRVVVTEAHGRLGAARIRAHKVARKLNKAADALRDAAKSGAGTYSAFQQQYEEEINRVRHRARRPSTPRMDWAQQ